MPGRTSCSRTACSAFTVPISVRRAPRATASELTTLNTSMSVCASWMRWSASSNAKCSGSDAGTACAGGAAPPPPPAGSRSSGKTYSNPWFGLACTPCIAGIACTACTVCTACAPCNPHRWLGTGTGVLTAGTAHGPSATGAAPTALLITAPAALTTRGGPAAPGITAAWHVPAPPIAQWQAPAGPAATAITGQPATAMPA
mmetsp:Transcript_12856/g.32042  ORF Transcript_12856/g.32042 Transcript_12856/m.32042 type:complete len:201 (+) Transcript_12856:508-1110(+)